MKALLSAALFAASLASAPAALAQAYAGASLGASKTDFCAGCDNRGLGFKVFGGYKFNPYVAAEAAYVNLGEFKAEGNGAYAKAKPSGAAGFLVVGLPVDEAWIFAKGGVAYFDTKLSASIPGFIQFSDKDTSTGAAWGFGASYPVWRNLEVRAEWERFRVSGATVDLIGAGLAWKF